MAGTVRTQIAQLLSSHRRRVIYAGILSLVALFVMYEVVLHLRQRGITMVREVSVLDCPYDGNGAHTHDASCYDEEGNLVCLLEERELHVHDDSCYTEERVLVCGMEESEGHTHTEECYDEEGNLTCELEESEGHQHTEGCYEVVRTLTCGQEEVTEVHVHGPGCFKTIWVDDGEEDATASSMGAAQTFTKDLKEQDSFSNEELALSVMVNAPVGALPPESDLVVTPIEGDQILQGWGDVDDLLHRELGDDVAVRRVVAARLELVDAQGEQIAPVGSVQVRAWADFVRDAKELVVVRLVDGGDYEQLEPVLIHDAWLVNWDEENETSGDEDTLQFWMDRPVMAFAIVELGSGIAPDELDALQEDQQVEEGSEQQAEQVAEQPEDQQVEQSAEQVTEPQEDQKAEEKTEETAEQPEDQQSEQSDDQKTEETVEQQEGQRVEKQPEGSQLIEVTLDFDPDSDSETETDDDEPATTDERIAYPAQDFEGRAGNVKIVAKAPRGAFPAGTTMRVEVIDTGDVKDAVTSAVPGMVETVVAVDIAFFDADGVEVQPLVPIQVTMTNDDALDNGQPIVLHVDDEGEASVVEQTPIKNSHNEVNFDVGSFLV